eukprot:scaffold77491_cov56-Attheya_sp.AAC.3
MESEDSGFQLEGNSTSNCRQSSKHPDAKKKHGILMKLYGSFSCTLIFHARGPPIDAPRPCGLNPDGLFGIRGLLPELSLILFQVN